VQIVPTRTCPDRAWGAPASGSLGVLEEHVHDAIYDTDEPVQVLVGADQSTMTVYWTSDELRSVSGNMRDPETSPAAHVIGERSNAWQAPALAGDDAGDGVTAWEHAGHVIVSIWDATAPDLKVTAPDRVVAGRPFSVSVGASDTLSALAGATWALADAQGAPAADLPLNAGGTATVSLPRPGRYTITGKPPTRRATWPRSARRSRRSPRWPARCRRSPTTRRGAPRRCSSPRTADSAGSRRPRSTRSSGGS
jgi:hypothetical protein